jgi:hypothetical protein
VSDVLQCPRVEDAAGYVLRALPDGEWEAYRYHVDECEECAAKVAELGFVSHALLSAVPQLSAPPDIRNRVMSVVRAEAELLQAAGPAADRPVREERGDATRSRRLFGRLRPLTLGALASVLVVLGVGAGTLLRDGSGSCTTRAGTAAGVAANATVQLKVCDGNARLALSGMPSPPDGRIYELWLLDPKAKAGPMPAGLFSVRNGRASVDVGAVEGSKTVLVTDEPLPNGSEQPTKTPIVSAST